MWKPTGWRQEEGGWQVRLPRRAAAQTQDGCDCFTLDPASPHGRLCCAGQKSPPLETSGKHLDKCKGGNDASLLSLIRLTTRVQFFLPGRNQEMHVWFCCNPVPTCSLKNDDTVLSKACKNSHLPKRFWWKTGKEKVPSPLALPWSCLLRVPRA